MLFYDYAIIYIMLYYYYTYVCNCESLKIAQNQFFDQMTKRCKMDFSSKILFIIEKKILLYNYSIIIIILYYYYTNICNYKSLKIDQIYFSIKYKKVWNGIFF